MTNSPPPSAIGRESELLEHYAAVKARLANVSGPAPRVAQPRPESPFMRAIRDEREAKAAAIRERQWEVEQQAQWLSMQPQTRNWREIVHEVAAKHGLAVREIMSKSREQRVVRARHECFWRIRNEVMVMGEPISLPMIGKKFGGMDHTSVLHGYRKHDAMLLAVATGQQIGRRPKAPELLLRRPDGRFIRAQHKHIVPGKPAIAKPRFSPNYVNSPKPKRVACTIDSMVTGSRPPFQNEAVE